MSSYEVVITPEIRAAAAAAPMPSPELIDRVAALLGPHLPPLTDSGRDTAARPVHARAA